MILRMSFRIHISTDLHEKFPESVDYLDKVVVQTSDEIPPDADKDLYITNANDFLLRSQAVNRNSMYVVQHFIKRVELMIEELFKPLFGVEDYTAREKMIQTQCRFSTYKALRQLTCTLQVLNPQVS